LKGRDYMGDLDIHMKMDIKEECMRVWTGFIWLRVEFNGGILGPH
jgi:hypothetical protein